MAAVLGKCRNKSGAYRAFAGRFDSDEDGGEIYHVVLYMGDNQVVHASSKATGIKVSNVYWEHAVQAVRLL